MNLGMIRYIIGWVIELEALFMSIPCVCALVYKEKNTGLAFLITAIVALVIGLLLTRKKPQNQQFFSKEGFTVVGLSWIVMSLIGAVPMYISGQIPSFIDALFEMVSGFTTTGSSIVRDVEALDSSINLWRCFSHWIGGMGVFVFLMAILPMAGGDNNHLMRAESPGPSVGKLVPKMRDSSKILYIIYFVLTFVCFLCLIFAKMPVFDSLCTAFGTAGTGGFGIKGDSLAGYSSSIQWIVTIFMILFGVNFNFYFFLLGKNKLQAFKMEEVKTYFLVIFAAIAIIVLNIYSAYSAIEHAVRDAAFSVGSVITTTGFATADFNLWPSNAKVVLIMLMFVGACAGSTGGGIKVSRFIILGRVIKEEIVTFIHPRSVKSIKMDGKAIDRSVINAVLRFFGLYIFIFAASVFVISLNGYDLITTFTSVAATFNNIGPGLEICGPTGNFASFSILSKLVFIFDMLAGRLELYPIIILLYPKLWKK